jgi:hypothetical protein
MKTKTRRHISPARFIKLEGAIEDTSTGLLWASEDLGTDRLNWANAKKAAATLDLCGLKGWRLPTIRELLTLADYERSSPAIDPIFSSCKSDWYWTSTPLASSPGDYAWYVFFSYGNAYCSLQGYLGLVRAVRARQ